MADKQDTPKESNTNHINNDNHSVESDGRQVVDSGVSGPVALATAVVDNKDMSKDDDNTQDGLSYMDARKARILKRKQDRANGVEPKCHIRTSSAKKSKKVEAIFPKHV